MEILINITAALLVLAVIVALVMDKLKPMPVIILLSAQVLVVLTLHIMYDLLDPVEHVVKFSIMWITQFVFIFIGIRLENRVRVSRQLRNVMKFSIALYAFFMLAIIF